ncbi:KCNA2, partial [Symbiodinium microadriaticum]
PTYSWHYQTYKYITQSMNIIDLVAILPFYIGLGSGGGAGSVSIVRILRLARVLRVFKIGGFSSGMTLIGRAIHNSLPAIGILFFFATLGVILFGSIIYFVESGTYVVNEDFPEGEYVRWNFNHSEKEKSPFVSILVACYWAVVTSTTVGYGELHPTSPLGRFLSMVLMYVGILVLALPISVIGAAFTREYEKQHAADEISVAGGNTKGRGGEVDAERRHLLSLSFREEEEEEEVVV